VVTIWKYSVIKITKIMNFYAPNYAMQFKNAVINAREIVSNALPQHYICLVKNNVLKYSYVITSNFIFFH